MKVTTQAELDSALADPKVREILIDSPRGVWINIPDTKGKSVVVGSTASINTVAGTVERVDSGGTVERVYSGGTVKRVDSGGTVKRVDSGGTVKRVDSGGTVHLDGGRIERAGSHAAVFLHSASVVVEGGILIDLAAVDKTDPRTWCDFYGVEVITGDGDAGDRAVLFKAVDSELRSGHYAPGAAAPFSYPVGEIVEAPDWLDNNKCGHGLHFSPSPIDAQYYNTSATRFLRVEVPLAELRPIDDGGAPKCKARLAQVVAEVTLYAEPVAAEVSA
jgi:hypothetical protein